MFNFINEFGLTGQVKGYKYVNFNGEKVYVQGFKNLLNFDENSVTLKLKDAEMKIEGTMLNIEELGTDCILIQGKIVSVKVD